MFHYIPIIRYSINRRALTGKNKFSFSKKPATSMPVDPIEVVI